MPTIEEILAKHPEMRTLPALSIRQPWAALIVNGFKDVENRTWVTEFRGRVLIHAGKEKPVKKHAEAERQMAISFVADICGGDEAKADAWMRTASGEHDFGGIVGIAEIIDCVTKHSSPWFTGGFAGDCGFVMKNARPLPFVPCRGMLGFFYPKFEL